MRPPTPRSRRIAPLLAAWCLFAAVGALSARAEPGKGDGGGGAGGFLWKVMPKGAPAGAPARTVYLLGSIHVGTPEFYPLPDEVEAAFEESTKLVVEVDTDKVGFLRLQKLMAEKGMYQDGTTLADHVDRETLAKFRAYCKEAGLPVGLLESFRPWAAAVTITMTELQKLGYRPDLGIDQHFIKQAKAAKKPVLELESAEAQIDALSSFGEELEAKFLAGTLEEAGQLKEVMGQSAAAWKSGDPERLKELLIDRALKESPEMKPVMVKLLDERNVGMAKKIEGYLKGGGGPHFVVVGAGHLVGDKGLVKLMEKAGHKVERVRTGGAKEPKREPAGAGAR